MPNVERYLAPATEAFKAGKLNEAETQFTQVLSGYPQHFVALLMLGVIAGRTGRTSLAVQRFGEAIAVQPQSTDARLLLANLLRETGDLGGAISLLEESIRLRPKDAVLHNDLGLAYLSNNQIAQAIERFEETIRLDVNFAIPHFNLARALERQRRTAEAIAAYRRAVALAPQLTEAYSRLGNLLHGQGDRLGALANFRLAAAASPNSGVGRLNQAKALLEEGKGDEAEAVLWDTLTVDPQSSEAHRLLGNVLRETGRFDEAITYLTRAIDLDATQIAAYHDLVHCKRLAETDRPLIAQLLSCLEGNRITDQDRALLHFAAGKVFDDLGEWAEAIRHFDEANRLERRGLFFNRQQFAALIDNLIVQFTSDAIARYSAFGSPSAEPVLIVGMPRSGTTLVEQIVSSHPKIGAGGELSFWNERGPEFVTAPSKFARSESCKVADDYCSLLRRIAPGATRVTDKMPFNFFWLGVIRALLPNAYIIHCRRHPIDTCLSVYFTRFATRQDFAYARDNIIFYYNQYDRLMRHWRQVLSPERFLEIEYEDIVARREDLTRQLIAFTGLEWNDRCLEPEKNRRIVKTASMWQARQPVYQRSVARWRNYEPWLGEFLQLLPRSALRQSGE